MKSNVNEEEEKKKDNSQNFYLENLKEKAKSETFLKTSIMNIDLSQPKILLPLIVNKFNPNVNTISVQEVKKH